MPDSSSSRESRDTAELPPASRAPEKPARGPEDILERIWPIEADGDETGRAAPGDDLPSADELGRLLASIDVDAAATAEVLGLAGLDGAGLVERLRRALDPSGPDAALPVDARQRLLCAVYRRLGAPENAAARAALAPDELAALLRALEGTCETGAVALVAQLVGEVRAQGFALGTAEYNALLSVLADAGDLDGTASLYAVIKDSGVAPDEATFGHILRALGSMRGGQDMLAFYEQQLVAREGAPAGAPALVAAVMRQLNLEGQDEAALALFERYGGTVAADDACVRAAMRALVRQRRFTAALQLVEQQRELGMTPSIETLETVLQVCISEPSETGLGPAKAALDELQSRDATATPDTFARIMSALTRAGQPEASVMLFQDMLERGLKPERRTLTSLVRALAETRALGRVLQVYESMVAHGIAPDQHVFLTLLDAVGRCGSPGHIDAVLTAFEARGARMDVLARHVAMEAFTRRALPARAFGMFEQLVREHGFRPQRRTFHALLKMYTRRRMHAAALDTLRVMGREGVPPTRLSYALLASAFRRQRDPAQLERLCELVRADPGVFGALPADDADSAAAVVSRLGGRRVPSAVSRADYKQLLAPYAGYLGL